jgi:hypothetical protein
MTMSTDAARFRRENAANLLTFARDLLGGDSHINLFLEGCSYGHSIFHSGKGAHAINGLSTREKLGLILLATNIDLLLAVIKESDT